MASPKFLYSTHVSIWLCNVLIISFNTWPECYWLILQLPWTMWKWKSYLWQQRGFTPVKTCKKHHRHLLRLMWQPDNSKTRTMYDWQLYYTQSFLTSTIRGRFFLHNFTMLHFVDITCIKSKDGYTCKFISMPIKCNNFTSIKLLLLQCNVKATRPDLSTNMQPYHMPQKHGDLLVHLFILPSQW